MEVQIVSKKLIIPSTPNKNHPDSMKLSRFDQLALRSYVVLILYYAETETGDKTDRVTRMEKSLADTLSVFYPFAGRFNEDDMSIDCNNHGAEFIEAKVSNCLLNDLVLPRGDQELLSPFVPAPYEHSGEAPLVCVQVNVFECGGIALALSMSHVLCDAYTVALFLNAWASASRNTDRVVDRAYHPSFDLASIFPPRDTPAAPLPPTDRATVLPVCVTRRFVFDGSAMSRLRALNADAGKGKPSRVLVVTGLLWRAMMRARGRVRPSLVVFPVNLRGRTKNLAIPPNSCGNFVTSSVALFNPKGEDDDCSVELHELVGDAICDAVAKASSVLDADGLMAAMLEWREVIGVESEGRDVYYFTSWCRMGHYEADFGWGRPSWISSSDVPMGGLALLTDARDGEGVEAWVGLDLQSMLRLQRDPDIVAFTSNNHGRVLQAMD